MGFACEFVCKRTIAIPGLTICVGTCFVHACVHVLCLRTVFKAVSHVFQPPAGPAPGVTRWRCCCLSLECWSASPKRTGKSLFLLGRLHLIGNAMTGPSANNGWRRSRTG